MIARLLAWYRIRRQRKRIAGLLKLCQRFQVAFLNRDTPRAAAIVRGLLLSERRVRKALRRNAPPEAVAAIAREHEAVRQGSDAALASQLEFRSDQTAVLIHAATTEELAIREFGSLAWEEFPGGAQELARSVLRPGMMFYNVTFLNPAERYGKQFQLFFWDGWRWGMLGPAWRILE
jgi:hypothetical protein